MVGRCCCLLLLCRWKKKSYPKMKREKRNEKLWKKLVQHSPDTYWLCCRYETGEVCSVSSSFSSLRRFSFPCQTFRPIDCLNRRSSREESWEDVVSVDEKFSAAALWQAHHIASKKGKLFSTLESWLRLQKCNKNEISSTRTHRIFH